MLYNRRLTEDGTRRRILPKEDIFVRWVRRTRNSRARIITTNYLEDAGVYTSQLARSTRSLCAHKYVRDGFKNEGRNVVYKTP